jgi:hypothetical protein
MNHLVVGEAKKGETLRCKRSGTHGVSGELLIGRVRGPIDLDEEPCVERDEVGDEAAERDLAAKAEAPTSFRRSPRHRPRSALVAFRLRLPASDANLAGMARPPSRPSPARGEGTQIPSVRREAARPISHPLAGK